ncbi:DsbA family protein [Pseudooceanicola sp. HF7]|uniref:DsbA family oxidoreductase n=1 Tax=Pseudooceanicola sp. HF7 TaxID=2721560 RepID=UPI0014308152|nr:DsbA family oxidoreductase [Pseudooceanicola sp. HF7]NIZ09884.1 DsbA family oxidoreductase [Pseudooceanicola sp. HF7]
MTVKLDILSDPICPWCYIGKTQLDRALAQRPAHPFVVEWHPFQLNPEMPREGMGRREYLVAKFGEDGADTTYGQIADHARSLGIEADFDAITRTPNTLDAHRLIHWAGLEAVQGPVVDGLFRANFVEGRDISQHDVLADVADQAGMDASVVLRLLATSEDEQMIRDRDAHSRKMGVTSVPTFIVAQKHAVPGAQPVDLWLKVMDEIIAQLAEEEAAGEEAAPKE